MNQEQMMAAFIQWLPTKVKELQNKSPEEIVNFLNQLNKENPDQAKALVQAFQAEVSGQAGMFKAGGKMNAFVKRFQPGGKTEEGRLNEYVTVENKVPFIPWNWQFAIDSYDQGYPLGKVPGKPNSQERDLFRIRNSKGEQRDRIYTKDGRWTERRIKPNGQDTTFVRSGWNLSRIFPYKPGDPEYDVYTQRWKDYGIYKEGGAVKAQDTVKKLTLNQTQTDNPFTKSNTLEDFLKTKK